MKIQNPQNQQRATSRTETSTQSATVERKNHWSLGFDSRMQSGAFALCALTLFIAPFLFSGFWPVTHDASAQGFCSALAAVAALLLALSPRNNTRHKISRGSQFLIVFFAWCALSSLFTVYAHDTILELSRILTACAWFLVMHEVLCCEHMSEDEDRVLDVDFVEPRTLILLFSWICGLALICVLSIVDFLQSHYPRQSGTFYNANLYATACAMTLPLTISLALLLRRWRKIAVLVGIAAFVLVFVGLFLTSSKGGLLAFFAAMMWCVVALLRAQKTRVANVVREHRVLVFGGALLLIFAVGFIAMNTVLPRLLNARNDDNSTLFRAYTWRSTWQMALARPIFGWGAGSFSHVHEQFAIVGFTRTSHQSWLQLASENGIAAPLLLMFSCLTFLSRAWKMLRTRAWPRALGASGAVVAFAVHGLTDAPWSILSIIVVLMLAFALLDAPNADIEYSNDQSNRNLAREKNQGSSRLRFGWLGVALLMAAASYFAQRASSGEEARDASLQAAKSGNSTLALELAQSATQSDPISSRVWSWLGVVQHANGDVESSEKSFARATNLNPQSATAWRSWADNRGSSLTSSTRSSTIELWNRAVSNAPRDTSIRLARARLLLSQNAQSKTALADLETIIRSRDEPYGRYPALADFDNLDFARASLLLAQRAAKIGDGKRVVVLAKRALEDIARARPKLKGQRDMAQFSDNENLQAPTDLDEMEAQFKILLRENKS